MLDRRRFLITGATRGIGRAIALRLAKEGACIGVVGKTDTPHPKLDGTIHSVVEEINSLGGDAIALKLDVQDAAEIQVAVSEFVEKFDGIDGLINNASALKLGGVEDLSVKDYDLIMGVNVRATVLCIKACMPYLKQSESAHVLTLSPPLNLDSKWIADNVPYTISKYGMSLATLGLSKRYQKEGVRFNSLWPRTTIATAAVKYNLPPEILAASRKESIMSDAAYHILSDLSPTNTGHFYIDEEVLRQKGVTDFSDYAITPGVEPFEDIYIN